MKKISAKDITYFAILLALVIVLQTTLGSIKIGVINFSVVLIPIVVGSILLGWLYAGLLGLAFGLIVLIYGIVGIDPFTNILFTNQPVLTILTCLVKGVMAGVIPALIYKAVAGKNKTVATIVSAISAPIVNTGLFIVGALCMSGVIAGIAPSGQSVIYFLIIGCAGLNFIVEFIINAVVAPALARVVQALEKNHLTNRG